MSVWQDAGDLEADVVFDFDLDHGRCIGVRIPELADAVEALAEATLPGPERMATSTLYPARRRAWVGGRVALRRAMALLGVDGPAVLPDDRGAPVLPPGIVASISHKDRIAVALLARETTEARIGVDVENDVVPLSDISSHVLAGDEIAELRALDPDARAREVVLRFSTKEAVYKALDPFVRRYVGFKEVSISPGPNGDAVVRSRLRSGEGPFAIDVRWRRFSGLVLTTARVSPVGGASQTRP